ncbi:MAG: isochorismatase family cysteine hydrolase [Chloroflexota bacterium]|nr:cysteine hydrolase [Dehalococcoidia bacterium]MDW8252998.1 isochorismatase family cysteine hydrolase [Chloroflexota bacterium]
MAITYFGKNVLMTLEEWVNPTHSAVVVVDVQNDFCSLGGYVHRRGQDITPLQTMLTKLRRLLDGARRAGTRVVYVQHTVARDGATESPAYLAYRLKLHGGDCPELCLEGTWGHQICAAVAPQPGDLVVRKHRQPPWIGTDLDQLLRANGVQTVIATGTMTSACVDWTARLGVQLDYYVVVPEDCVAQTDCAAHDAAIAALRRYLPDGGVTTSEALLQVWGVTASPGAPSVPLTP